MPVYNCILTDSEVFPPVDEIEEDLGDEIEAKTPSAAAKAFVIAECEASGVTEDAGFILVGTDRKVNLIAPRPCDDHIECPTCGQCGECTVYAGCSDCNRYWTPSAGCPTLDIDCDLGGEAGGA